MYTLQDFLTLTKGQEYLIAIGAMILFLAFWLFLERKPRKESRNQIRQSNDVTKPGGRENA